MVGRGTECEGEVLSEAGLVRSAAAGRDRRRRGAGGGDRGESCESAKLRKSCV